MFSLVMNDGSESGRNVAALKKHFLEHVNQRMRTTLDIRHCAARSVSQ
jgi:hypothetical protein